MLPRLKSLSWVLIPAVALLTAACSGGKSGETPAPKSPAPAGSTNPKYTAAQFDEISRRVFGPIYPALAKQVVQQYGITEGTALDAGCGSAYFGIELARATNLRVTALDVDPEAVIIAGRNIAAAGLGERIKTVQADVREMPFPDGSFDLVISRGSYPFWKEHARAFREIARVLKPGGVAFIGGGLGSLLPVDERNHIRDVMAAEKIGPPLELEIGFDRMAEILRQAGILVFKIAPDEGCLCGLWVEFRKPAAGPGRPRP